MPYSRPVLLALLALAACSPALDWREVRPEGSGLTLLMPCRPSTAARELSLAGRKVRWTLVACSAGGSTWAAGFADVGDPAAVGTALIELRQSAARNLGAAESPLLPPVAVAGATPYPESARADLAGRLPDGTEVRERMAVFARGTIVFQVTVVGSQWPADAADSFFGALRLGS